MWLLTGKTLYFFTVLLSGSGSRFHSDRCGVLSFCKKADLREGRSAMESAFGGWIGLGVPQGAWLG